MGKQMIKDRKKIGAIKKKIQWKVENILITVY